MAVCVALTGAGCGPVRPPEPHTEGSVKSLAVSRRTSRLQQAVTPTTPSARPVNDDVERALAYDPDDPLGELEAADALDRMASSTAESPVAKPSARPPDNGCVVIEAGQRIWPAPGPAAIASIGQSFVVAGYAMHQGREQLFLVRAALGAKPEPITAFDITPPATAPRKAAPALSARDENDVSVAFVDGASRLWVRRLRLGRAGHGAATEIASGLDPRFTPALTHQQDRTLVAWTKGSTPMRTELLALSSEDSVLGRNDVTPGKMGAAAGSFVVGASPPVLIAVDARNGMSPLLRIELGNDGAPKPAQVALPVSMVSSPPQLAAAQSSIGTYVAYAGLGAAAKSAIGLVSISRPEAPVTMVTGTAYGALHVSAAAATHALFFAADAPVVAGTDPRREVHVHVVSSKGMGAAAIIRGPGSAAQPSIAHTGGGRVGLVFTSSSGVYVAHLRCDEGG